MDEFLVHFCCRHPRGWCGLKSLMIIWETAKKSVATREGGVG